MRRLKHLGRQDGFMAIVLVVFLVVFVAMAAAIVSMSTSGARSAADHVQGSAALYMAESGIEWAARSLIDADDRPQHCEDELSGAVRSVNDAGTFEILFAEYIEVGQDEPPVCRVRVAGSQGAARRVISASIPLPTGGSAESSIFDDPSEWNTTDVPGFASGSLFPGDGTLFLTRNDGCGGPNYFVSAPDPASMLGSFSAGDEIYLMANHVVNASCAGPPSGDSGLRFLIFLEGGTSIQCDWAMIAGSTNCPATMAPAELTDEFDLVLSLGNGFAASQVTEIRVQTLWNSRVMSVALSQTCIGSAASCLDGGVIGDDPVQEGSWDENP